MIRRLLNIAVAGVLALGASASDITSDVRVGTLGNGLTYYIQHNENPAGSADFFLAQRAGSVLEDEDQRGLAHFLEHMCFNGTKHFLGNSLITYLESIGVKFGAHLNAYTSTDETVYNISKVPVGRATTVDSCMLILRDWSCALLLDTAEINAERGVIVNEWRQRRSASNRMLEKASPRLYGGTAYGERLPIGLMSVVENFEPSTLRRFYDKWYIPANQAVIIVGDVDVADVEKRLKKLFSRVPARRNKLSQAISPIRVPVADRFTPVVESDAEQGAEMLQLYFRLPDYKDEVVDKVAGDMAATMLVDRFDILEDRGDCPYVSLALGQTRYLMAGAEQAFTMRGPVKTGRATEALAMWYGELLRAIDNGFADSELDKARGSVKAISEERMKNLGNASNTVLAKRCARHFIDGGRRESLQEAHDRYCAVADTMTGYSVAKYLGRFVNKDGRGVVALNYRPVSDDGNDKAASDLSKAFYDAGDKKYDAFVFTERQDKLLAIEPARGSIVSTDSLRQFDTKVYVLSNGIKVLARRSDSKPGQLYVRGFSRGGLSRHYAPADVPTLLCVNELMAEMPCGGLSQGDIRAILAGKKVKVSMSVGNNEESIEASTSPEDMADAFALMYLRATGFEADSTVFKNFVDAQRDKVSHRTLNPVQAMGDTIHSVIYSRHPLAGRMTAQDVDHIDLDKAVDIYRDRFSDMGDFTFMVVGDFDTDSLADMLTRYIAALPGGGRSEDAADIGYRFAPGEVDVDFTREMENAKGIVYSFRSGKATYDLDNLVAATAYGQLLRIALLAELRERRGLTYSVRTHAAINPGINPVDGPQLLMPVYIMVTPGSEDEVRSYVDSAADSFADSSVIDGEHLKGIREFLVKNHAEAREDGAYWLKILKAYVNDGIDLDSGYDSAVARLSPESVAAFVKSTVVPANKASITMRAKEK